MRNKRMVPSERVPHGKELLPQHKLFADYYLISHNGTEAYKEAGYKSRGHTAEVCAYDLPRKPEIATYIADREKELAEKLGVTQEWVREGFRRLAALDIRKAFNEDGTLKNVKDLDDETASSIVAVEVDEVTVNGQTSVKTKRIRFLDRRRALTELGRHIGFFAKDKVHKFDMATNGKSIATLVAVPAFADDVDTYLAEHDNGHDNGDGKARDQA